MKGVHICIYVLVDMLCKIINSVNSAMTKVIRIKQEIQHLCNLCNLINVYFSKNNATRRHIPEHNKRSYTSKNLGFHNTWKIS
jgi:hypothetical protein